MFDILPGPRQWRSPFYDATIADGVTGFTLYNQRLMPMSYGNPEAEYWRLIKGVSQWDVAGERQIEIAGPDAQRCVQALVPRDLSAFAAGRGKYVALCDHAGRLINDPVLLKLDEDRYWLSIADSNMLIWCRALAAERNFDVSIRDARVSPMAVQGPKAIDVVAAIFGDWIRDLKFFGFRQTIIDGIPLVLARSGWSKQGGYELYLMDEAQGTRLWGLVREAGRRWDIGPGYPNPCERIESGLLSWGADTGEDTNPFEVRLERYIDLDLNADIVGIDALRRIHEAGPARHQLGLILEGEYPAAAHTVWYDILSDGRKVGDMTNGVWSRRLERNIGYALIAREFNPGASVSVRKDGEILSAELTELPFL